MVGTKASGEVESRRRRRTGTPGTRMACPTPRMLVRHTQHHPLSVPDEQINHGKRNSGPAQSILLQLYDLSTSNTRQSTHDVYQQPSCTIHAASHTAVGTRAMVHGMSDGQSHLQTRRSMCSAASHVGGGLSPPGAEQTHDGSTPATRWKLIDLISE